MNYLTKGLSNYKTVFVNQPTVYHMDPWRVLFWAQTAPTVSVKKN